MCYNSCMSLIDYVHKMDISYKNAWHLSRFGARYIDILLRVQHRRLEIINDAENDKEDLLADLTAILYSLCTGMYGQRFTLRKTERIAQELETEHATG